MYRSSEQASKLLQTLMGRMQGRIENGASVEGRSLYSYL